MPTNWSKKEWDAFRRFADNVNPQCPHALDEERWRDFIITSHRGQQTHTRSDVETVMIGNKNLKHFAGIWADRYEQDQKLLAEYDSFTEGNK